MLSLHQEAFEYLLENLKYFLKESTISVNFCLMVSGFSLIEDFLNVILFHLSFIFKVRRHFGIFHGQIFLQ